MSNKEKIELEKEITEGLSLIGRIDNAIERANDKLNELKKDEVKPVFPVEKECDDYMWVVNRGDTNRVTNPLSNELPKLTKSGQTFRSCEDAERELSRMQARAYVIEAINRANGGDNGFKAGEINYLVCIDPSNGLGAYHGINPSEDYSYLFVPNELYIRSVSEAKRLRADEEFVSNYKTMLGIK